MDENSEPVAAPHEPTVRLRRYGRFAAPGHWAREFKTELKRVMGQCIVFRAEHLFDRDQIEYWAASEHFRHVPLGEMAPEYRWFFTDDGGLWAQEVKPNASVWRTQQPDKA